MGQYPDAVNGVLKELGTCLGKVRKQSADKALGELRGASRIFVAGAGRSGLAARGFAMRLMHLGKTAHLVGETTTPAIGAGDLLVIGSGSGRTESLLAMARKARKLGARILLLTIDPKSPIAGLCDCVIEIPAPSPKATGGDAVASMQPMGSLFEQSLFILFDTLIVLLMRREGASADEMFKRHANLE